MKSKSAIIIFLLLLVFSPAAHAATPLMGEAYGQVIETMSMSDTAYEVTIDDLNAGEDCDNDTQLCLLKGFSWADKIGWTLWDGEVLQSELGASEFPNESMAKVSYRGSLGGYIWGEKYGWVQLSVCAGIDDATGCGAKDYCSWINSSCEINKDKEIPDVGSQTLDDWGVYIDFCTLKLDKNSCEASDINQYCNWDETDKVCVFDGPNNPNGFPFRGYAWSEYLGWIKFGPQNASEETEFAGAYTKWYPDLTPPKFESFEFFPAVLSGNAWIPNQSPFGNISWLEFADENESLIDLDKSKITVVTDHTLGVFDGCQDAGASFNGNVLLSQGSYGEVNVDIQKIGKFGPPVPPYGFCKFTLSGVIYNGSGFGYYFGPAGQAAAVADLLDLSDPPDSYEPNIIDSREVTLYVRAGDPYYSRSFLDFSPGDLVADGNNYIDASFGPKDAALNPIVSVKTDLNGSTNPDGSLAVTDPKQWIRDVELEYNFNKNNFYAFDSLSFSNNYGTPPPVLIDSSSFPDFMLPLQSEPVPVLQPDNNYLLTAYGFAPTSASNVLQLDEIALTTDDAELPAISQSIPAIPAAVKTSLYNGSGLPDSGQPGSVLTLPHPYSFTPALDATAGSLDAGFLTLGLKAEATFEYQNFSSDLLSAYSIDNLLAFDDVGGGVGEQVLEINNINLIGSDESGSMISIPDPDSTPGRSDIQVQATRYELLYSSEDVPGFLDVTRFHNASQNLHSQSTFFHSTVDPTGVYQVDGSFYVENTASCKTDSSCLPVPLDRTDSLPEGFGLSAGGSSGDTHSFTFGLLPSQFIGEAVGSKVLFGIDQYLAYRTPAMLNNFFQYAIYPATSFIDGVEVKSIGLGTSGIVSGGQVFESVSGRDLETISTTSSADLRRDVRKNVASLTRTLVPCQLDPASVTILNSLPSDPANNSCVALDEVNHTIIAYYKGPGTIQLGNGALITVRTGFKYSLILTDGANLYLNDNIIYPAGDTSTSFGMILMQNDLGTDLLTKGANVFLSPLPTNLVGLLYAEGSLLSSPDGGTTFYYGAGADSKELKNQLYWQGSIASRNTIGGAPNKAVPDGVDCDPWGNIINCAQAYDLDYLRRFTTVHDSTGIDYAPAGYFFSGGGKCDPGIATNPGCILPGGLPSTVSLSGAAPGPISINVTASKSLDTFFIERDNRPVPPGFSSGGGLTSTSEIR